MEVNITISLSGSFDFANRERIEQQILRKGLKISKEVNKKCQFLIVGRNAHENKIQEAKRLNLPLISSSYLEDLIHGKTDDWKQYVLQKEEEGKRKRKVSVRIHDGQLMKKQKISVSPSKQPAPPKSRVIALEGQIGVGKSTLCGKFEKTFPDTCSSYKEQTNEQFLKLFYSDTKKYGFAFQWGMLKSRIYQLQLARHNAKYPEVPPRDYYFWDRSMLGDYMFALWNHLLGGISREEMDVYESEFGGGLNDLGSVSFLQDIDCFVLLNDEPANCKYRVEQKRKNESEQGIPLDYYDGIDDMHFNIFMKLLHERVGPVLILNWGQYHDPQLALTVIEEVCTGARRTPIVKYINEDEIPTQDPAKKQKFYVYRTGKQITEAFDELKVQEDLEDLRDYSDIYIPLEALTVKKKVVKNNYNVAFHENAYKRIVLWHLSQFQNVIFYSQS